MRFITLWVTLIFLLAMFAVGREVYHNDNTIDIYNYTKQIKWNSTTFDDQLVENYALNASQININRVKNIIYKGVDAMGYIAFEVAKWGVETGFNKPEWNYLWIVKWLGILLIILFVFPVLYLLPMLFALIYLFCVGVKLLYIKIKNMKGVNKNG